MREGTYFWEGKEAKNIYIYFYIESPNLNLAVKVEFLTQKFFF